MHLYILLLIIILCCMSFTESLLIYPVTVSSRSTRNMTYDIRCLPKIKKNNKHFLFKSEIIPNHYGKCIRI